MPTKSGVLKSTIRMEYTGQTVDTIKQFVAAAHTILAAYRPIMMKMNSVKKITKLYNAYSDSRS
jgi:hypothetical protein